MAPDHALKTYPVGLWVRLLCFGATRCPCHRLNRNIGAPSWVQIVRHNPAGGFTTLRSKEHGTFEVDQQHPVNGYRYDSPEQ